VGRPPLNPEEDRIMLGGSPSMLKDFVRILDDLGFKETRGQNLGNYVIERAFVE
jgi:ferredoxin--NADP+ reductase